MRRAVTMIAALISACTPDPAPQVVIAKPVIVERPLAYDEARKQRTIAYRRRHEDPAADSHVIDPKIIVLHYTGGGELDATRRYFNRQTVDPTRTDVASAGDLNVSAHFLIDRDGTIIRLMPETWMARHVIGLNHLSIGIENVGDADRLPLTPAQLAADIALIHDLASRYPGITHVIGHHEYRAFEGHPYFKEREADHRTHRTDPGPAWMQQVRAGLTNLALEGPPS